MVIYLTLKLALLILRNKRDLNVSTDNVESFLATESMAWSVRCAFLFNGHRDVSTVRSFYSAKRAGLSGNYNGKSIFLEVLSNNKYICHGPSLSYPLIYHSSRRGACSMEPGRLFYEATPALGKSLERSCTGGAYTFTRSRVTVTASHHIFCC
jgi:hypothetical protein